MPSPHAAVADLCDFLGAHDKVAVLTGAGCSTVPVDRVRQASEFLQQSDALLVVGSSLMVFSGYRFVRMASAAGLPIAIVNRGATRADPLANWRVSGDCCSLLAAAVGHFGAC